MSLILVRGLPGSGKSTIAKALIGFYWHIETDMFWVNDQGVYEFDAKRLGEAHEWCRMKTIDTMTKGFSVVVSNTFTTKKELQPYFDLAKEFDCVPQVILAQGQFGNIHSVPEEVITKMRDRFEYDIRELYV